MAIELPRQNNYEIAIAKAWDLLESRASDEFVHLGALPAGDGCWRLPVLETELTFDRGARTVNVPGAAGAGEISHSWKILALHYLLADVPVPRETCQISFESIPEARGYAAPYRGRVVSRFCHTAGRNRETVSTAAASLGGQQVTGGDLAFRLQVFPHVPLTIVWYDGDEELPPGASFLYLDNIQSIMAIEDIVVMAERVVSRLGGKSW